jgi:hypothetical protein
LFSLSRQNNFELLVPLNDQNSASGKMFWDDGESANTIEDGLYQINTFEFKVVKKVKSKLNGIPLSVFISITGHFNNQSSKGIE